MQKPAIRFLTKGINQHIFTILFDREPSFYNQPIESASATNVLSENWSTNYMNRRRYCKTNGFRWCVENYKFNK